MGRVPLLLLVSLAVLVGAQSEVARATDTAGGDLLPDLVTAAPTDLQLETLASGERRIRFANEIVNAHTGPLELAPKAEDCDGDGDPDDDRTAYQRVFRDGDGDGVFTRGVDAAFGVVKAGCMFFHPAHDHWHFEDFARYSLRAYNGDGTLGPVVRTSDKVSFCVADEYRRLPGLAGSPSAHHYEPLATACHRDATTGLSVGWSDKYDAHRQGQHVDVTGLAAGDYCLVSSADPSNRIVESDERNNSRAIRLTLTATDVRSLSQGCTRDRVQNGSFEESLTGWAGYNAGLSLVDGGAVGGRAVRVAAVAGASYYSVFAARRQVPSTSAGTTYVAHAHVRAATPGRTVCLRVREWRSGSVLATRTSCVRTVSGWQEFPTLAYEARESGNELDLGVYQQTSANAGDSFEVDGVSLVDDVAEAEPPAPANLVANGSFETSLTGWHGYEATLSLVDGGAEGSRAARVALAASSSYYSIYAWPRHVSAAKAGATYTASARVRSAAPGKTVCLRVREWAAGRVLATKTSCLATASAWQRIAAVAYVAQGDGNELDVGLYQQTSASAGDSFDVDDVRLTLGEPAAPANLIVNGSFETSLTGWHGYEATLSLVDGGAEGSRAARVALTSSSGYYSIYAWPRHVPATKAGAAYTASARVRSAAPGKTVCLRVREWAAGRVLATKTSCLATASTWQQLPAVAYVAQDDGNELDVGLYQQTSANAGDSFDVDAVELAAS